MSQHLSWWLHENYSVRLYNATSHINIFAVVITILKHTPPSAVEARKSTQHLLSESFTLKITPGSSHLNPLELDGVQTRRAAAVRAEAASVRTGAELSWAAPGRFVCVLVALNGTCSSTCSTTCTSTCSDMTAAHPGLGVTNISCHIWARLRAAWRRGWLDFSPRRRPSSRSCVLDVFRVGSVGPEQMFWTLPPADVTVIYALMSEGLKLKSCSWRCELTNAFAPGPGEERRRSRVWVRAGSVSGLSAPRCHHVQLCGLLLGAPVLRSGRRVQLQLHLSCLDC